MSRTGIPVDAALLVLFFAPPLWAQSPRDPTNPYAGSTIGRAKMQAGTSRAADTIARRTTELADAYVRGYLEAFPETAFMSGVSLARHDGLTDNSLAALASWRKKEDGWWKEVKKINPETLWGRQEWITYGFLKAALEASRVSRICHAELWPVSQLFGWQATFAQLADLQPVGTAEERAQALNRWRQLPRYLDTEVPNLGEGLRRGYSTPRHNVELALNQLDDLLKLSVPESPFAADLHVVRPQTESHEQPSSILRSGLGSRTRSGRSWLSASAALPIALPGI